MDQYGRTLANIYVNDRDAGEYLVTWDFARRWQR
jgi:endonuclease YncB( thermonuclease family)